MRQDFATQAVNDQVGSICIRSCDTPEVVISPLISRHKDPHLPL